MSLVKKVFFVAVIILLVATLLAAVASPNSLLVPVGSLFLIVWSFDKARAWWVGEPIGLRAGLEIPENAPKVVRLLGLLFVCLIFYTGFLGLLQYANA